MELNTVTRGANLLRKSAHTPLRIAVPELGDITSRNRDLGCMSTRSSRATRGVTPRADNLLGLKTPFLDPKRFVFPASAEKKRSPTETLDADVRFLGEEGLHDDCRKITREMIAAISARLAQVKEEKRTREWKKRELVVELEKKRAEVKPYLSAEEALRRELTKLKEEETTLKTQIESADVAAVTREHDVLNREAEARAEIQTLARSLEEKLASKAQTEKELRGLKQDCRAELKDLAAQKADLQIILKERDKDSTVAKQAVLKANLKEAGRMGFFRGEFRGLDETYKDIPSTDLFAKK